MQRRLRFAAPLSVLSALVLLAGGFMAFCQDPPPANIVPRLKSSSGRIPINDPSIRLDVKLVLVPANVMDRGDRPILSLQKDDFHLFEDAVEQNIQSFSIDQAPVSVGIVFDASGSMKNKIDQSFAAVDQFLKTSIAGDEFSLVQFSDVPILRTAFTPDTDEITRSLSMVRPQGWTALVDAVYMAVHHMRSAKNSRKALLVLSDGGDNNSRYSDGEIINLLREADVRVYAIGLFDNPRFLRKAAEDTGGHMIVVHNLNDLPNAVDKLSIQLRSQYLLGYYPNHTKNDGKYHRVKVQVIPRFIHERLFTSWRHGYYAPN
jgi:VWFA-related protein